MGALVAGITLPVGPSSSPANLVVANIKNVVELLNLTTMMKYTILPFHCVWSIGKRWLHLHFGYLKKKKKKKRRFTFKTMSFRMYYIVPLRFSFILCLFLCPVGQTVVSGDCSEPIFFHCQYWKELMFAREAKVVGVGSKLNSRSAVSCCFSGTANNLQRS